MTTLGILAAAGGLLLLTLAVAALFYREVPETGEPTSRLAVLVPAHNEADFIQRCVASLKSQEYPAEQVELVVIADNCTDQTAELAQVAGAAVLVRDEPGDRGKGQALRWAIDQIRSRSGDAPDGFIIVDGDSVADTGLLKGLAKHFERGADAVQAEYLVLENGDSPAVQLRAIAFLLFHRVRFAGRAALKLPCSLVGNGMLLSRRLMEQHPWDAFTGAEDLEYSVTLRLSGVKPAFAGGARVRGPIPTSSHAAQVQRERWEGGRLKVASAVFPGLLREILFHRRLSLLDLVLDLAVPPLGLLTAGACSGTLLAGALSIGGVTTPWILLPWLTALLAIVGFVLVGLRSAHAPAWMYRRLLSAPAFVLQKVAGTGGVLRHRSSDSWIRTERPSEVAS